MWLCNFSVLWLEKLHVFNYREVVGIHIDFSLSVSKEFRPVDKNITPKMLCVLKDMEFCKYSVDFKQYAILEAWIRMCIWNMGK